MLYIFSSACFITALISLIFSGLVYYKNPSSKTNLYWALMCLATTFWSSGLGLMPLAPNKEIAQLILVYVHYFGAIFIPAFFLHFVLSLLDITKNHKALLFFSYASTLFLQIANLTGYLATIQTTAAFPFYTKALPCYHYFTFIFSFVVVYSNYLVFKYYKTSTSDKKIQLKYLFLGMVIGFSGGSTAFFPVYNIPLYPFGLFFAFTYIPIISYSVIKHQLMGIDIFLKKWILYLFFSMVIGAPLFLSVIAIIGLTLPIYIKSLLIVVLVFVLATLILKLKIRAELNIENIIFGKKINYRETLKQLHHAFISQLDLNTLLKTVINTVSKTLDIREIAIFIKSDSGDYKISECSGETFLKHKEWTVKKSSPLYSFINTASDLISPSELFNFFKNKHLPDQFYFFQSVNTKLILPFKSKNEVKAFLVIGNMNTDIDFSNEDLDLFRNLATEISIAIENANIFRQIQELNKTLDDKVSLRTHELEDALKELKSAQEQIVRSGKLASIGTLAAGIAHEINNALNATVNSAMNLNRFWDKLTQEQELPKDLHHKMETSIGIIHRGMERTRNIVDHLMRFSRKNEEGFKPDLIHEGIDSTLEILSNELKVRKIKVTKEFCDTDLIYCNLSELNQVFFNLFANSLDAIDKNGHIYVTTTTHDNIFNISIKDDGIGIDSKNLEQIFDPFFTTKPVGKGTGLGLATSYNIVKDHGGQIHVKSMPGKGTEFIISIPLVQQMAQKEAS